jgi:hypothetical protein
MLDPSRSLIVMGCSGWIRKFRLIADQEDAPAFKTPSRLWLIRLSPREYAADSRYSIVTAGNYALTTIAYIF